MDTRGFTLLELMIVIAIMAVISALSYVALDSSIVSMNTAALKADVMDELRNTMMLMTQQLQLAAKEGNNSLNPPLEGVAIVQNPAQLSPVEIVFQIPLDDTGLNWSRPIHLRHINGDINGDGNVTRRVVRMQDLNGDGVIDPVTETFPLGAANNITDVQFARNGDLITVTLTAEKQASTRRMETITATLTGQVYLLN